jgi:hypothetical protein
VSITDREKFISNKKEKFVVLGVLITEERMMKENTMVLGFPGDLDQIVNIFVILIGNWFLKTRNNG